MSNEVMSLNVQMNTKGTQEGLAEIIKAVNGLKTAMTATTTQCTMQMLSLVSTIKSVQLEMYATVTAFALANAQMAQTALVQQEQNIGWLDGLAAIADVCTIIQTLIDVTNQETIAKLASKAEDIAIIALYVVDYVQAFGVMIAQLATSTAAWIANTAAKVGSTAAEWAQIAATTAWNAICSAGTALTTAFGAAMAFLTSPIGLVVVAIGALIAIVVLLVKNWDSVKAAAVSVWEAIKGAFAGAWEWFKSKVLDPITGGFKGMINGVIGFLNSLIGGIVKGINAVIGLLNKIRIDVPDAVPIIGGLSFGFDIPTMTAPQIPLLARGAVLPANKPFLALVGDQRHGTNVEAPLATIQQAVSLVMQQQSQRLEQRLLQSVQVQNQILEAVLGIEIGDSVIARAAERYRRKMAVVKGEYV